MKNVLVLEEGVFYDDTGPVVCVAFSKAALLRWVKANRPGFRRDKQRPSQLFFTNEETHTWLRCDTTLPAELAE